MSSTSLEAVLEWQWPYIVASFTVATVGSLTSLLIMKHRTSASGLRNHLYLLAGATAFGAVGVFSMHFIGMQALHLLHPTTGLHLPVTYYPVPTTFSLLVVVLIAVAGFGVAGDPLQQQWWRYAFGGVAGAGGVLAMHYLGMTAMCMQATIEFSVGWVAISVLIGWVVVSVGLLVFFRFRAYWQHNSFVLAGCSLVLGVAVCGVHYTGMQSATYHVLDEAPSDLTSLPPSEVLFGITLGLASLSCLLAFALLTLKYTRMLHAERAKLACLTINAVIVDPSLHVLTTVTLGLPTVIIDPSYVGKGSFDDHNPDFLRMLKASTSFSNPAVYSAFLTSLLQRRTLTAYSLALHHRFLTAAQALAELCQLSVTELGLLYWTPTGTTVTMVMSVEREEAERITKTSDLRFLPPATLFPFIAALDPGGVEPEEWLDRLIEYHRKTQPMTAKPPPVTSASPSFASTSRLSRALPYLLGRHMQQKVSPMPSPGETQLNLGAVASPRNGAAEGRAKPSTPPTRPVREDQHVLHLGLLFVRVTPAGLHIMVPARGPYYHIPMVPLVRSLTRVTSLAPAEVEYLRELHRSSRIVALPRSPTAAMGADWPHTSRTSSRGRDVSTLAQMTGQEEDLELLTPQQDPLLPGVAESEQTPPPTRGLHLTVSSTEPMLEMTPRSPRLTLHQMSSASELRSVAQQPFSASLKSASIALAALVGSSQDVFSTSVLVDNCELVPLDEGRASLLPLVVMKMGGGTKGVGGAGSWQEERVSWVWLPTFEALQSKAGARVGWVRRLLKRVMTKKADWEGSRTAGSLGRPSQLVAGLGSSGGYSEDSKSYTHSVEEGKQSEVKGEAARKELTSARRKGDRTARPTADSTSAG